MIDKHQNPLFQTGAARYATYLETPEGGAIDLASDSRNFCRRPPALCALWIGGGTSAIAMRLARLGLHAYWIRPCRCWSSRRGRRGKRSCGEGCPETGRCRAIGKLVRRGSFDVTFCHNLLEYVDDPVLH